MSAEEATLRGNYAPPECGKLVPGEGLEPPPP
jgi:hypothetical protein